MRKRKKNKQGQMVNTVVVILQAEVGKEGGGGRGHEINGDGKSKINKK